MTEPESSGLAEACQRGDESAFAELYRRYGDGVFHVAQRVLHDEQDATDALQETFLTAFRRISTYRGDGSLKAWLYQVAVRASLRILRQRKAAVSLDDEAAPPATDDSPPPADRDFRDAVQNEIQDLPERARLVFVLYTAEDMSHAEIATALDVSVGTSKSQLNYARSLLRQRLARWC